MIINLGKIMRLFKKINSFILGNNKVRRSFLYRNFLKTLLCLIQFDFFYNFNLISLNFKKLNKQYNWPTQTYCTSSHKQSIQSFIVLLHKVSLLSACLTVCKFENLLMILLSISFIICNKFLIHCLNNGLFFF
jgi:hypothetical protein